MPGQWVSHLNTCSYMGQTMVLLWGAKTTCKQDAWAHTGNLPLCFNACIK